MWDVAACCCSSSSLNIGQYPWRMAAGKPEPNTKANYVGKSIGIQDAMLTPEVLQYMAQTHKIFKLLRPLKSSAGSVVSRPLSLIRLGILGGRTKSSASRENPPVTCKFHRLTLSSCHRCFKRRLESSKAGPSMSAR